MTTPRASTYRPLAIRLLKFAITLTVVAAVAAAANRSVVQWNQHASKNQITLADVRWHWLGLSSLVYAISLLPASLVLQRALAALGQQLNWRYCVAAQLVGHLGKYVPGKAMVIVVRTAVLSRSGTAVPLKTSALAVILETLNLIAAGALLGCLLVLCLPVAGWLQAVSGLLAVGGAVVTHPAVLRLGLTGKLRDNRSRLNWTTADWLVSWGWGLLTWVLAGLAMTLVVLALLPAAADIGLLTLNHWTTAAVSLAFVAGFLSLLPGGLGVREAVLATLVGTVLGPPAALLAAVVARASQLVVECLLAAAAWGWSLRALRPSADSCPESSADPSEKQSTGNGA